MTLHQLPTPTPFSPEHILRIIQLQYPGEGGWAIDQRNQVVYNERYGDRFCKNATLLRIENWVYTTAGNTSQQTEENMMILRALHHRARPYIEEDTELSCAFYDGSLADTRWQGQSCTTNQEYHRPQTWGFWPIFHNLSHHRSTEWQTGPLVPTIET